MFEGVSKTTHSVQYSDTTDAIFSLVYIYFIPVFGLCFDLFGNAVDAWLCVRACLCVCVLVRVSVCEARARAQEKNTVCLFHDIPHEI